MTSIQALASNKTNWEVTEKDTTKLTGSESFAYALQAAQDLIQTNIDMENTVSQKTIDFMTGANDNIVDLMVAQEKAGILLQYTLQVRNGVVSAYKEIMNLSV